jgi:phage-related baseplate assembly protein
VSALPVVNPADFLPLPDAIEALSYEALVTGWKTKFKGLWPDYDVDSLESDPGVIIAEAYAYLRLDDRARVNDVYRRLRLPLANGADLDGLAADRGVKRIVLVPATATTAAVMEGDTSLLLRTWLRMQAWGSGSPYGIEYHARTLGILHAASLGTVTQADVHVIDHPGEGRITCVVLAAAGLAPADAEAMRAFVGNGLMDRRRRPGAVWIDTVLADIVTVPYAGLLKIRRGASKSALVAAAEDGLATYMLGRRRIGALVPVSAMQAVQMGYGVIEAQASDPPADVVVPETAAAELGEVAITAQVVDD